MPTTEISNGSANGISLDASILGPSSAVSYQTTTNSSGYCSCPLYTTCLARTASPAQLLLLRLWPWRAALPRYSHCLPQENISRGMLQGTICTTAIQMLNVCLIISASVLLWAQGLLLLPKLKNDCSYVSKQNFLLLFCIILLSSNGKHCYNILQGVDTKQLLLV